jgi:Tol biopolymer transport system component
VWTPNSQRIVFTSGRGDGVTPNLWWQRADRTGAATRLTTSRNPQYPASWDPDGKYLFFYESNPQTGDDLMILPMEGDEVSGWKAGIPEVLLNTPADEIEPMVSPDGRWLAYARTESGFQAVYVRPVHGSGPGKPISPGGGTFPAWSQKRHELFFQSTTDRKIMVVPYSVEGDEFRPGPSRVWSDTQYVPRQQRSIGLDPNGERFAVATVAQDQVQAKQDKVVFIFNFFDELRRLAPLTKR